MGVRRWPVVVQSVSWSEEFAGAPRGWSARPCLGTSIELWYGPPDDGEGAYEEPPDQRSWREWRARQVCATCPVMVVCLAAELALPIQDQYGVRGGLTAGQRRGLLRRLGRAMVADRSTSSYDDDLRRAAAVRRRSATLRQPASAQAAAGVAAWLAANGEVA